MQSFLKFRGQRKAIKPGKFIFFFCVNLLTIAHLRDRVRALALSAVAWVNQEAKTRVYHALQRPRLGEKAEPRNLVFLAVFWQAAAPKLPTVVPHPLPSCPHYQSAILPSLPVWLSVSLSCVHSKSGPVSCLLCCFCRHTNQNCFPPPFTIFLCCLELWRFGLPHPSVPSSNWIKLMGHQAAFEVRCADTQKYPKYTGIPKYFFNLMFFYL